MKKFIYLIVLALILGLVLAGCTLLSNIGQVPTSEQSGITYLTKGTLVPGNLVGLWHFDDNAGDSSGYDNHGTVNGTTYVDGKFGKALSFNGVNNYVSVPESTSLDLSGEITVEAWIKVAVHKNFNAIVIKGEDGAENYELLLYETGRVHCPIKFMDGSRTSLNADAAITDTEWHHVAMTYKPGEWRIYVDGVQKAERTDISENPLTNNIPLFIGAEQYLSSFRAERFFNGLIDEVRIWDEALTGPQIAQSYELGVNDETEYITQLNQQDLFDGGVAIFTSAFYVGRVELNSYVDVLARAMIVGSEAVVNGHALRGITPKGAEIDWTVNAQTPTGFDITACRENKKAKSLHLSMLLNTDEGLGVNVQFLPYD